MSVALTSSIQFNPSALTETTSDVLRRNIDACITKIESQCGLTTIGAAADFSHAESLLKECIAMAGSNQILMTQIRDAVNAFNEKERNSDTDEILNLFDNSLKPNSLLKYLIENSQFSLAHLLIDLDINEIRQGSSYNPVLCAVDKGNSELVSHLLRQGAPADYDIREPSYGGRTALDQAIKDGNKECIKLLLQAGADSHRKSITGNGRYTCFETAVQSNQLSVLPLFFLYSHIKIDAPSVQKKLLNKEIEIDLPIFPNDFQKRIAKALPPLLEGSPFFTSYIPNREKVVECFLNPLISPPDSIKDLITPLQAFISKETREHPQFNISILPQKSENVLGAYNRTTENIEVYNPKPELPFDRLSKVMPPSLLHELCHKALDKLKWDTTSAEFQKNANKDMESLSKDFWKHCHPSVHERIQHVEILYPSNKISEEYLVRVPEILYKIAEEDPTRSREDVEEIAKRDIPNLFKLYKEKFLPELIKYST